MRPHITRMLEFCGYTDNEWFTEESRIRGSAVHALTLHYDLGALDLPTCTSPYKGWLLAYVAMMQKTGMAWRTLEQARYSARYGFGGRPDRVGLYDGFHTIVDIKSGSHEKWHRLQTALQAILESEQPGALPARYWRRYAAYVQENGVWKLDEHLDNENDLQEALGIIDDVCGVAA